ncbi:Dyp-type peroxidase domain-containing protein [Lewinella sp. W8]|uniref:Dyp-type peroxidase domain-containing protein n=1 Tax=Lewinella sp. W8 TaxID=2528208 RepID=UPI001067D06C|nr:Dyp-type peroxidase domain-containing protein [Lewinella sp. W8]MTB49985.1 hypothetical protein [Lewinella sp. W8]
MFERMDFQGGILKSHGRAYSAILLLTLYDRPKAAVKWIQSFADVFLISHAQQTSDTEKFKRTGFPSVVVSLGLSYSGAIKVGINKKDLPEDKFFVNGMRHRNSRGALGDYQVRDMDNSNPDVIIQVAGDAPEIIEAVENKIKGYREFKLAIKQATRVVGYRGFRTSKDDPSIGPFGFVDGISETRPEERLFKETFFKDSRVEDGYGALMAIRKISVDRENFTWLKNKLKSQIGPKNRPAGEIDEWAKAMIMGRFENGTPLVFQNWSKPEETWRDAINGAMDFSKDPRGNKCPFFAHVRVMRTAGSLGKIVRRSMLYQESSEAKISDYPTKRDFNGAKGMFFISYQKSISKQLIPLFKSMAKLSGKTQNAPLVDPDVVAYRNDGSHRNVELEVSPEYGGNVLRNSVTLFDHGGHEKKVKNLTKFHGGEFFYFPSKTFMLSL